MREKHAYHPIRPGHERFKIHAVQQLRFQKLALDDRTGYANDRIVREHHRALTYGIDLDSKLKRAQVLKKVRIKQLPATWRIDRGKILHAFIREREVFYHFGNMIHAAGNSVSALERRLAEEDMEAPLLFELSAGPVALGHGYLVQVR